MPGRQSRKPTALSFEHRLKPELERWLILAARLKEVREALSFVTELLAKGSSRRKEIELDGKDIQLVRGLYCFAVVTYIRCFATGRRRGLNIADVNGLTPIDLETHAAIHMLRNRHFAHPVADEEGASVLIVQSRGSRHAGFAVFNVVLASSSSGDVRRFTALVRKVARYVELKENAAGDALAQATFGRQARRKQRCLTPPSRGHAPAGFARLRMPLKSNVRALEGGVM
jgi:hypothetical protein